MTIYEFNTTLTVQGGSNNAVSHNIVGGRLQYLLIRANTATTIFRADLRFNARIYRDDVIDWAKDQVRNHPQIKNWVLSARVVSHLCSHDDAEVKSCRETEYVEWER